MGPALGELGPDLYRENAFRITGLGVEATARDIRRQAERLRVAQRLGAAAEAGIGPLILPLTPPPDAAMTEQALQRLREPVHRIVDEFFWFWSVQDSGPDPAIEALRQGDTDTADRLWRGRELEAVGATRAVATHNLAVLNHALAVERERLDSDGKGLWVRAFGHWQAVLADDAVWDLLEARIRRLSDPRLTTATVPRLRADLPAQLLAINARIAVRAARSGDHEGTVEHVRLLRGSAFDASTVDQALLGAVEPDLARLRALREQAEQATNTDPAQGHTAAERLLDQVTPLLAVPEHVLSPDHPLLRAAKDDIVSGALRCLVAYSNRTSDWARARSALDRLTPIEVTESVRALLEENRAALDSNLLYGTCWFCKANPADESSAYQQKMYGDVGQEVVQVYYNANQIRTTWRTVEARVPRCVSCRARHAEQRVRAGRRDTAVGLLFVALGIGLCFGGYVGFGIVTIVMAIIGLAIAKGQRTSELRARDFRGLREFEPIRQLLAAGWLWGERPPNTS